MYTFELNGKKYDINEDTIIGLRLDDKKEYYDKVKSQYNETTKELSFVSIINKSIFKPEKYVTYMSASDLIGMCSTIDILQ